MKIGSSQRARPNSRADEESCPSGGRCLWRACGGQGVLPRLGSVPMEGLRFPTARAHQLGGRQVLPRRRSVLMECFWGTVDPNGPGPLAGGTRIPALASVRAYGGPMRDGSSQQPGPTTWGDGKSCRGGGRTYGGRAKEGSSQRAHQLRGRGVLPGWRSVPMEGLRETVEPTSPRHHLGGRGVVPRCRSVPTEGLRWLAVPNGPGPPGLGTGILARAAANAHGGPAGDDSSQWPRPAG